MTSTISLCINWYRRVRSANSSYTISHLGRPLKFLQQLSSIWSSACSYQTNYLSIQASDCFLIHLSHLWCKIMSVGSGFLWPYTPLFHRAFYFYPAQTIRCLRTQPCGDSIAQSSQIHNVKELNLSAFSQFIKVNACLRILIPIWTIKKTNNLDY